MAPELFFVRNPTKAVQSDIEALQWKVMKYQKYSWYSNRDQALFREWISELRALQLNCSIFSLACSSRLAQKIIYQRLNYNCQDIFFFKKVLCILIFAQFIVADGWLRVWPTGVINLVFVQLKASLADVYNLSPCRFECCLGHIYNLSAWIEMV